MKSLLRLLLPLLIILLTSLALSIESTQMTEEPKRIANAKNIRIQLGGTAFGSTQHKGGGIGTPGYGVAAALYYQFTYVPLAVGIEGIHSLGENLQIPFRIPDFRGHPQSVDIHLTKMFCVMPGILIKRSKPGFQPYVGVAMGRCDTKVLDNGGNEETRRDVAMLAHLGGDFGMGENLALSFNLIRVGFLGEEIFINPVATLTFLF